jgi:hypothetical protein
MSQRTTSCNRCRCLKCPGCKAYLTQRAAHEAAASNAETEKDRQNWEAAWRAFQIDYVEDLKCTDPQEHVDG